MNLHEQTQEALLLQGEGVALDDAAEAHVTDCGECQAFAEALGAVDAQLMVLTPIEPPPALLERTLEAARSQPAPAEPSLGALGLLAATFGGLFSGLWAVARLLFAPFQNRRFRIGLAIAAPALGVLALFFGGASFLMVGSDAMVASEQSVLSPHGGDMGDLGGESTLAGEDRFAEYAFEADEPAEDTEPERERSRSAAPEAINGLEDGWNMDRGLVEARDGDDDFATTIAGSDRQAAAVDLLIDAPSPPMDIGEGESGRRTGYRGEGDGIALRATQRAGRGSRDEATGSDRVPPGRHRVVVDSTTEREQADLSRSDTRNTRTTTLLPGADANRLAQELEVDGRFAQLETVRPTTTRGPTGQTAETPPAGAASPQFFWRSVDGVQFQSASGYWANTYVPGDPAIRALRRRLADQPAAERLAELAQPNDPHLDPPRHGALAMRVAADRAQVEGRSRVLVSVGLRGAAQRAGRRPTLRTQIVLDLRRPLDADGQARIRALLTALSRTRDGADRTGVIVAGPHGGELLALGTMRFGEVSVALRRAFEEPSGPAVSLASAMETAVTSIGQLEDDASPLGSSLVLLVSPQLTDADAQAVARVAHTGTLAGVTTTAVGLGDGASLDALERVALAGHGRRRVLSQPRDATSLVRAELTSVSRVVARAVRVRIRLAEGVQLVDVLGSRRLDDAAAQRVRASEQAIDRALASRLGITSDRGDDEDGIQIVVPAFYADDAHTILLDVVVPGPGPVLDAQVRFKDLLRLGNGTLTDRLQLGRGSRGDGPQQRAVLTERLGYELASALRDAARQVERGQAGEASATLMTARARIEDARRLVPELGSEPSLARDQNLVDRFRVALGAGTFTPDSVAGSLRYAAHRRQFGDPLGLGGSD